MTLFGYQLAIHRGDKHQMDEARYSSRKSSSMELTLANIPPGYQAKVLGFSRSIPADRQARLQSYGLVPGSQVRVVQHSPVTIIQVEHLELALERELANEVQVMELQ